MLRMVAAVSPRWRPSPAHGPTRSRAARRSAAARSRGWCGGCARRSSSEVADPASGPQARAHLDAEALRGDAAQRRYCEQGGGAHGVPLMLRAVVGGVTRLCAGRDTVVCRVRETSVRRPRRSLRWPGRCSLSHRLRSGLTRSAHRAAVPGARWLTLVSKEPHHLCRRHRPGEEVALAGHEAKLG